MKTKHLLIVLLISCIATFHLSAQCAPRTLPYVENFDNLTTLAPCFLAQNAVLSTSYSFSGSHSVKLSPTMTDGAYIIFPAVAACADSIECYFKIRGTGATANFYVGIVPDTSDMSSFMPIYTGSVQGTAWTDIEFNTSSYASSANPTFLCIYIMDGVSTDVYVDDVDIHALPICVRPSGFFVANTGMNDVTFSWTAGGSESQWLLSYTISQGSATTASNTVVVNQPTCTVTGLNPSTSYTYSVSYRAICGPADTSLVRTTTGSFSTSCMIISSFPYTEDFENTFSACHNLFNGCTYNTCTYQLSRSTTRAHSGSYSLMGPGENATTDDYPSLALPQMNFTDPNGYTVKFWMYRDASDYCVSHWANEGFRIYTSSRNDNLTDTTFLGFISCSKGVAPTESYVGWYQYSFQIPASVTGLNYVLIVFDSEYGRNGYIDDVTVEVTAGCRSLSATAQNISTTAADIVVSDTTATVWQIYYGENSSTAIPNTVTVSGASIYTLAGLSPNTQYAYYVRRICANDTSGWSSVQQFRTDEVADTLPFTTGFENAADDSRWNMTTEGWSNFFIGSDTNGVFAGSRALYVSYDNYTYGYNLNQNTQAFASRLFHFDDKEYTISFRYKCTGGESNAYGTIYDFGRIFLVPGSTTLTGGTSWMTYASYDGLWPDGMIPIEPTAHAYYCKENGDARGWNYMSYDVNMVGASGNYKFALMWNNESGGAQYPLAIDDLSITEISCSRPSPVVSQLTSSSANIHLGGASSYRLIVSNQPITDPLNPTGNILDTTTTALSVDLSGLTSSTTYYYTARAYCQNGDTSGWSAPGQFTTQCLVAVPYSESFEQVSSLDCWSYFGDNALTRSNSRAHAGFRSMCVNDVSAISPEFHVDSLTDYTLTGWAYAQTADVLNIGVVVDPTDASTMEPTLASVNIPANTWTEFTVNFNILSNPSYSDFSSAHHFTLTMSNGTSCNIDQLNLSPNTTCARPLNPVISDTVYNGFEMSWTDTVASEWIVRVTNDSLSTVNTYLADSAHIRINDLIDNMSYTVEVAAVCAVGDTSIYTSCGTVTTPLYVPTCADPSAAPTVDATTSKTMTVTANGHYQSYQFAYGSSSSIASATLTYPSTSDRAVITGLTANTPYYVWFRGVCQPGDTSRWSAAAYGATTFNDFFTPQNIHVVGIAQATSTTLAWGGAPDADHFDYELVNGATGTTANDTVVYTTLSPATTYTFRVRGIKTAPADTTAWAILTFKTIATAATTPYFCDFETASENNNWMFENGNQTNHFVIGSTDDFNGNLTNALFVSGDDSTNIYQNVTSTVYAMRTLNLNAGDYKYNYNWVCAGEPGWIAGTAYDYPRIFLAPATMQFTAGTVASGIGYGFNDIPSGCFALDSGIHLTQALSQRIVNGDLHISESGFYNIVVFWTNDNSTMYDPAITLDSIRFAQLIDGGTFADTICYGTNYTQHGFNVPATQLYVGINNLRRISSGSAGSPDTVYYAVVTMRAQIIRTIYDTICTGDNYTANGYNLTTPQSGYYPHTGDVSVTGCDSSTYLYLHVVPTSTILNETVCKGEQYVWYGTAYTQAGTYTHNGYGVRGCPVNDTLHLSVIDGDSSYTVQLCSGDTYYFVDTIISTPGTYSRRFFDRYIGCTVTYTVTVTMVSSKHVDYYDIACEGYPYSNYGIQNLTVTRDTVVTMIVRTQSNCDSTTNVHIRFVATTYSSFDDTIPSSGVYYWGGQTLTEPGDYPATLISSEGCDSVVTLHLHGNPSAVDNVIDFRIDIVPNPVNIGSTAYVYGDIDDVTTLQVLNSLGQVVSTFSPSGYPIEISGITSSGIYYVRFITSSGVVCTQKLIVR